jgi:hypothetical protein
MDAVPRHRVVGGKNRATRIAENALHTQALEALPDNLRTRFLGRGPLRSEACTRIRRQANLSSPLRVQGKSESSWPQPASEVQFIVLLYAINLSYAEVGRQAQVIMRLFSSRMRPQSRALCPARIGV